MPNDNDLIQILVGAEVDHSNGPTRIKNLIECARRVRLADQQEDKLILDPAREALNIGTITHKLVECHHRGIDPETVVPLHAENPELESLLWTPAKARAISAWPLFDKYADEFPQGYWGELVMAESMIDAHITLPNGIALKRSATIDAVWHMNESDATRVSNRFGLRDLPTGNILWDLKTATSKDDDMGATYEWDPQPTQYMLVAEACGLDPQGIIIFKAIRYKTDKQERFHACYFDREEMLSAENQTRFEKQVIEARMFETQDRANTTNCKSYGRMCPFRVSGECNGY